MILSQLRKILHGVDYYDVINCSDMSKLGEICADYGMLQYLDDKYDLCVVVSLNTETNTIIVRAY